MVGLEDPEVSFQPQQFHDSVVSAGFVPCPTPSLAQGRVCRAGAGILLLERVEEAAEPRAGCRMFPWNRLGAPGGSQCHHLMELRLWWFSSELFFLHFL